MREKHKKIKLILQFFEGSKKYFVAAVIASLATTILNALTPQIFRFSIDEVLNGDKYIFLSEHLWIVSGLLIAVAVLSGFSMIFYLLFCFSIYFSINRIFFHY